MEKYDQKSNVYSEMDSIGNTSTIVEKNTIMMLKNMLWVPLTAVQWPSVRLELVDRWPKNLPGHPGRRHQSAEGVYHLQWLIISSHSDCFRSVAGRRTAGLIITWATVIITWSTVIIS